MAGEEATIDMASLGTFTPDDQRHIAEPPKAEAAPEPEPTPAPEPAAAPEPEPAAVVPTDDGDDDEFEDITLDDIDSRIKAAIDERDPFADATETVPPEVQKLADENAALKAKVAEQEKNAAEAAKQKAIADMTTAINSTIGKFKMTDAEVKATTDYLVANPDLARGGMTFEEAAVRRLPGIADRAKSAPAVRQGASDGSMQAPPSANGAGAPRAFQHVPDRGEYSDVSRHIVQSGMAASLGKYT